MIRDAVEGRLWPLDDPLAAARCLSEVLGDEGRYRATAAAASRRHATAFSAEIVAELPSPFLGDHVGPSQVIAGE